MNPAHHPILEQVESAFLRHDPEVTNKERERHNVRLLQQLYGAFLEGNVAALLDSLTEDVDWQVTGPPVIPFVGAVRGREGVQSLLMKAFETLADQQPAILDVIAQGDLITVTGHETGRYRATGCSYQAHWVHVFTFRDGRVAQFREYLDASPFLEAMGLYKLSAD